MSDWWSSDEVEGFWLEVTRSLLMHVRRGRPPRQTYLANATCNF